MAKFRFILVEPEYEANLGASARLLSNFGQKQMHLVNPDCHIGFTAIMHAKHAKSLLLKAKNYKSVKEAVKGCSLVVGTSGVRIRNRTTVRHPLSIKKFSECIEERETFKTDGKDGKKISGKKKKSSEEIAILFGREGIGLNQEELDSCDLLITIPTDSKYPILNLTHALGIVLYELCSREKTVRHMKKSANAQEFIYLRSLISKLVNDSQNIKKPRKTEVAIKRLVSRAMPDELEVRSLISLLKRKQKE